MAYNIRPGIVLVRICDADLLVATHSEWESCPVIRPIPKLWAVCWRLMEQGKNDNDVINMLSSLMKKPEEVIRGRLSKVFMTLTSEGLMIESSDEKT